MIYGILLGTGLFISVTAQFNGAKVFSYIVLFILSSSAHISQLSVDAAGGGGAL